MTSTSLSGSVEALMRPLLGRGAQAALRLRLALLAGALVMLVTTLTRLPPGFYDLVSRPGRRGAHDLAARVREVHAWFAGQPVYGTIGTADYPPASYALLWPFLGWLDVPTARVLWALSTLAMLVWFSWLLVRESGARGLAEQGFVALLPWAGYAGAATIRLGQVGHHLLPLTLASLLLLLRGRAGWRRDAAGAALFTLTLVKPHLSAPFFWLVTWLPRRWRPAALIVALYAALTALAVAFQGGNLFGVARDLGDEAGTVGVFAGHGNVSLLLWALGLESWILPAALVMLAGYGVWVYRWREADLWLLLAVTALFTRLWISHRHYDDVLVVFAMLALFRVAKFGAGPERYPAGLLLALNWALWLSPGPWYSSDPNSTLDYIFRGVIAVVWLLSFGFLIWCVQRGVTLGPAAATAGADDAPRPRGRRAPDAGRYSAPTSARASRRRK